MPSGERALDRIAQPLGRLLAANQPIEYDRKPVTCRNSLSQFRLERDRCSPPFLGGAGRGFENNRPHITQLDQLRDPTFNRLILRHNRVEPDHQPHARSHACQRLRRAFRRIAPHWPAAPITRYFADPRKQQAQIIVYFRGRSDRGAVRAAGVLVRDRDGGRNAVDPLGLRLVELFEKLPRVGREAFDVSPLALGVERIEGHAGLAAPRDAAKHNELPVRQVQIDLPQVIHGHAAQLDRKLAHALRPLWRKLSDGEPFIVSLWRTPVNLAQSGIIQAVEGNAAMRSKKSANPFYVLLVIAGMSFAITATAYVVLAFREARPAATADSSGISNQEHPLMVWMRRHGEATLLAELGFLAVFTFAAIGTDNYWQRRTRTRQTS